MLRALLNPFRRPAIRFGPGCGVRSRFHDPQLASFLGGWNRKTLNTDLQDAVLRGRKLVKQALVLLLAAGGAWVVLESAKALSMF
jgi:hypothetical protein